MLTTNFSCTPPIVLSVDRENIQDTLYIYADTVLPLAYNKETKYSYDQNTKLYEYILKKDDSPLIVFKSGGFRTSYLNQCADSVKAKLNLSYLKLVGKNKKLYIAKNKSEIIELFKNGNNGRVTF